MKKAINIITTTLFVLVLLFAVALLGVRLFGITPYTVLSGSMEPTYHVGSLIYVKEVNVYSLEVGDPLTYVIDGNTVVTHRIVEIVIDPEDLSQISFKTKGDNNNVADGAPVYPENVLGKPVFSIPLLGYVAYFVQNPPGCYIAILFCALIVLLTFLPDLLFPTPKKQEEGPPPTELSENDFTDPDQNV